MVSHELGSARISLDGISPWADPNQLESWSPRRLREIATEVTKGEGRRVPEHIRYIYSMDHTGRLDVYSAAKTEFEDALNLLPKRVATKLRDSMEALRYIDWEHTASGILDSYLSHGTKSFIDLDIHSLYNPDRNPRAPTFRNMKAASRWLAEQSDELPNLERLLNTQRITMKGRIDGIEKKFIGSVRDQAVFGNEQEKGLSKEQREIVETNLYLSFEELPALHTREEGREYGQIIYPAPESIKPKALERIAASAPEVFQAVQKYQSLSVEERQKFPETKLKQLTSDLVRALAEERYSTYATAVQKLGEINSAKSFRAFIYLCADLSSDMMAIHPLTDGNGRSIRLECLYDPLNRHGISRPRLSDPNKDILVERNHWRDIVLRGVVSTDKSYRDIANRIKLSLPIENSPELIFPDVPRSFGAHEVHHKLTRIQKRNSAIIPLDSAQFTTYLEARMDDDRSLTKDYDLDPLATIQKLRDEFKNFQKETHRFLRSKHGLVELLRLQLVDADFSMTFGQNFAASAERWQYKMARWYSPEIVWRGMCNLEDVAQEEEIEQIFRKPSHITVSNRSANYLDRSAAEVLTQIRREFQDFNQDVVQRKFFKMAQDHADAGELYAQSYGLSTSRKRSLAGAFAMGALVVDDDMSSYKKNQGAIKDRLIVGAFRANKDVDLVTLRRIAPDFRCNHPRQAEVLAIGGIDPDAVMYVHRLDSRGKIQTTWMRDPKNPSQVLVVDGDAVAHSNMKIE